MAGILANSSSQTMVSGDTAADKAVSDYITGEQITLSTTPTGTDYAWAMAIPGGSTPTRSALSAQTGASVKFTPDVAGNYTITCIVDSTTTYVLRVAVTSTAVSQLVEAIRLSPKADSAVPTPASGAVLFYSSTQGALCVKNSAGAVFTVDLTAVV